MKPKNVVEHEHWFHVLKGSEEARADICVLNGDFNAQVVVWFVEPNVTVQAASLNEAQALLKYLNFSEEHPE